MEFGFINVGASPARIELIQAEFSVILPNVSVGPKTLTVPGHIKPNGKVLIQGDPAPFSMLFPEIHTMFDQRDVSCVCTFSGIVEYRPENAETPRYYLGFHRELHGGELVFRIPKDSLEEYSY